MMAIGWAGELKKYNIASNALWPKTTIDTAAVRNLLGGEALVKMSRTTDILADAAYYIFSKSSKECTGNCLLITISSGRLNMGCRQHLASVSA